MKLILEHDVLVLKTRVAEEIRNGSVYVQLDSKYDNAERHIKVNDGSFKKFDKSFAVKESDIKQGVIKFKLRLVLDDGTTKEFESNPIEVRNVMICGECVEDLLPVSFKVLRDKVSKLEKKVRLLSEAVVELNKKGEWL